MLKSSPNESLINSLDFVKLLGHSYQTKPYHTKTKSLRQLKGVIRGIAELSKWLQCDRQTTRKLLQNNRIPHVYDGSVVITTSGLLLQHLLAYNPKPETRDSHLTRLSNEAKRFFGDVLSS